MNGDRVHTLTGAEVSLRAATPRPKLSAGNLCRLWQVDGVWAVWVAGPKVGQWWLTPADTAAREVYDDVRADPRAGAPILSDAQSACVLVNVKDIRPYTSTRNE